MYRKINKIFRELYSESATPLPIEIILIDNLIRHYLNEQFTKYKFYDLKLCFDDPLLIFNLEQELDKEHICITLNEKYAGIADNYVKYAHPVLIQELNQMSDKVRVLELEKQAHVQTIAARDIELATTKDELATTKDELVTTKDELVTTKDELVRTKDELLTTRTASEAQKMLIENMSEALAIMNEEMRKLKLAKEPQQNQPSHDDGEPDHYNTLPRSFSDRYMDGFFNKKANRQNNALARERVQIALTSSQQFE